jgi:catechol 2,3-dioxygenase-like lactoylglutathione lyase family enzyme
LRIVIQHVTLEIAPDVLKACIAFYGVLDFEQVPVPPTIGDRAVWLQRSGSQVHLMPKSEPVSRSGHFGIIVERYDDTVALLRAGGHAVQPRKEHWGSPRAYVRDPAGNLVELMAWAPVDPMTPTPASRGQE